MQNFKNLICTLIMCIFGFTQIIAQEVKSDIPAVQSGPQIEDEVKDTESKTDENIAPTDSVETKVAEKESENKDPMEILISDHKNLKDKIDKENKESKHISDEVATLNRQIYECESTINTLNNKISTYKTTIDNNNLKINALADSIAYRESEIEKLDIKLIAEAQRYLFEPYNKHDIEEKAVPNFEMVYTKARFNNNQASYNLLKHYTENMTELLEYLEKANKQLGMRASRRPSAQDMIEEFKSLNVYKNYEAYKAWEGTYLGKIIKKSINIINQAGNETVKDALKTEIEQLKNDLKQK